jgi:hypothetical protein
MTTTICRQLCSFCSLRNLGSLRSKVLLRGGRGARLGNGSIYFGIEASKSKYGSLGDEQRGYLMNALVE